MKNQPTNTDAASFNIHIDSYKKVWRQSFPSLLKDFLNEKFKNFTINRNKINVSPLKEISVESIHGADKYTKTTVSFFSQKSKLDFLNLKFSFKSGYEHSILWGEIPSLTNRGTFILNGEEKIVIAYLGPICGLIISKKENKVTGTFVPKRGHKITVKIVTHKSGRKCLYIISKSGKLYTDDFISYFGENTVRNILGQFCYCRLKDQNQENNSERVEEVISGCFISSLGRKQVNKLLYRDNAGNLSSKSLFLQKEDVLSLLKYLENILNNGEQYENRTNPYSLSNKRLYCVGDLLEENIIDTLNSIWDHFLISLKVRYEVKSNRTRSMNPAKYILQTLEQLLTTRQSDRCIHLFLDKLISFFVSGPFSRTVPKNNPLEAAGLMRRLTIINPDSPKDMQSMFSEKVRNVDWSHYGRICPIDTPQGDSIGLVYSLTKNAKVDDYGEIRAPYTKIHQKNGKIHFGKLEMLSATEQEKHFIAYYEEKANLTLGKKLILAHKWYGELYKAPLKQIEYIDSSLEHQFSWAALLIPFIANNDANRAVMAANAIRQALPLKDPEPPLIKTGYEKDLVTLSGFTEKDMDDNVIRDGEFCFGKNLLVGYMPFFGMNYEDAIVISEDASLKFTTHETKRDIIQVTAEFIEAYKDKRLFFKREILSKKLFQELAKKNNDTRFTKYLEEIDNDGAIRKGTYISDGSVLATIVTEYRNGFSVLTPRLVSQIRRAKVIDKKIETLLNGNKLITIEVLLERKAYIGDKLSNRHGAKGVIGAILPKEKMPYFKVNKDMDLIEPDNCNCDLQHPHKHLEILLNPLGVFSRMNLGQLYETHLSRIIFIGQKLKNRENGTKKADIEEINPITPFKRFTINDAEFYGVLGAQKNPHFDIYTYFKSLGLYEDGKEELYLSKKPFGRVVIGYSYFMRLSQIAEEKLSARAAPEKYYDKITMQPTQGKSQMGGQRIGEMEFWALGAYNARNLIQEMSTIKSDNPQEKKRLLSDALLRQTETKESTFMFDIPESIRSLSVRFRCMGFDLKLTTGTAKNPSIEIIPSPITKFCLPQVEPNKIDFAALKILNLYDRNKSFLKDYFSGEVKSPDIGNEKTGYNNDGLFSEKIFGSLKPKQNQPYLRKYLIGYIRLSQPVLNPLFVDVLAKNVLGINARKVRKLLFERDFEFINIMDKKDKKQFQIIDILLRQIRAGTRCAYRKLNKYQQLEKLLLYISNKENLKKFVHYVKKTNPALKNLAAKFKINIENLIDSNTEPKKFLIRFLPVIPTEYRPLFVESKGKKILNYGNLNQHYLGVLNANTQCSGPSDIYRLQTAVAKLIAGEKTKFKTDQQSILQLITGKTRKTSIFRENILGKRVDYCGRAVIVPGPNLRIDECILPIGIVAKIFEPVIAQDADLLSNLSTWEEMRNNGQESIDEFRSLELDVLSGLNQICEKYNVLLNRQPSLHRLNIQAFRPQVTKESVIYFPPLITTGYGADHDGDTVAIHLPITYLARKDTLKMLACNNILSPAHGMVTCALSQDIAIGFYLMTKDERKWLERLFDIEIDEKLEGKEKLYKFIFNAYSKTLESQKRSLGKLVLTQKELLAVNETFSSKLRIFTEKAFSLASNGRTSFGLFDFSNIIQKKKIIFKDIKMVLPYEMRPETKGIISLNVFKEVTEKIVFGENPKKNAGPLLNIQYLNVREEYKERKEARQLVTGAKDEELHINDKILKNIANHKDVEINSPFEVILDSAARGDKNTLLQMVGFRGQMDRTKPLEEKIDNSIIMSSLVEGMTSGEYFYSSYGNRKTLIEKKLGVGKCGYLMRQLIELCQSISITQKDCQKNRKPKLLNLFPVTKWKYKWFVFHNLIDALETDKKIYEYLLNKKYDIKKLLSAKYNNFFGTVEEELAEKYADDIYGDNLHVAMKSIVDTEINLGTKNDKNRHGAVRIKYPYLNEHELAESIVGRILASDVRFDNLKLKKGDEIDTSKAFEIAKHLMKDGKAKVYIRSPLTCTAKVGICQKCYGWDMSTREIINISENVGLIAAQSLGEPLIDVSMKQVHTGGAMGSTGDTGHSQLMDFFGAKNPCFNLDKNDNTIPKNKRSINMDIFSPEYLSTVVAEIKGIYDEFNKINSKHFELFIRQLVKATLIDDKPQNIVSLKKACSRSTSWVARISFEKIQKQLVKAAIGNVADKITDFKQKLFFGRS